MSLGTILLIVLVIFLLGGFTGGSVAPWAYGYGWGNRSNGLFMILIVIVLALALTGRL